MVGISKLYLGQVEPSDPLRYGRMSGQLPSHLLQFAADKKPIVVWNITPTCNLKCVHCYASANTEAPVVSTAQAKAVLDDLAAFGVPVVLFSGGEPLLRPDIFELAEHAAQKGMRVVFSTNGTLITPEVAARMKALGVSYAGISLDGLQPVHDRFRGAEGAFEQTLAGIRNCKAAGVKVGLRVTLTQQNIDQVEPIFDLMAAEGIPRICFYHLVYTGRGAGIADDDLSPEQRRAVVDTIINRTASAKQQGIEVLTVDNHCDGPYLYLRLLREGQTERAAAVMELLQMNGGNSTGLGIACIGWDGTVYPDQFWRDKPQGNVLQKPFSEIWGTPPADSLLAQLRRKKELVGGRCVRCRFLGICGGNFRCRAEAATGELWGEDPACYLTEEEISSTDE